MTTSPFLGATRSSSRMDAVRPVRPDLYAYLFQGRCQSKGRLRSTNAVNGQQASSVSAVWCGCTRIRMEDIDTAANAGDIIAVFGVDCRRPPAIRCPRSVQHRNGAGVACTCPDPVVHLAIDSPKTKRGRRATCPRRCSGWLQGRPHLPGVRVDDEERVRPSSPAWVSLQLEVIRRAHEVASSRRKSTWEPRKWLTARRS